MILNFNEKFAVRHLGSLTGLLYIELEHLSTIWCFTVPERNIPHEFGGCCIREENAISLAPIGV
jgi:hypothetical protein